MRHIPVFLCLAAVLAWSGANSAEAGGIDPDPLARSTQMIVVTTSGWNAIDGRLQRYERGTRHDAWRPVSTPIPVVVGKSGLGWGLGVVAVVDLKLHGPSGPVKKEGDGKAPAGVFALGTAFGYANRLQSGSKMGYLELSQATECVDDAGSKHYNRLVERSAVTPDWNSSERMRSAGESYRWGIVVDHNGIVDTGSARPTAGAGSCIFLHIWKGPGQGTVGCTAMPQAELEGLLQWLDPKRRPLLVQLPAQEYRPLIPRWKLPASVDLSAP